MSTGVLINLSSTLYVCGCALTCDDSTLVSEHIPYIYSITISVHRRYGAYDWPMHRYGARISRPATCRIMPNSALLQDWSSWRHGHGAMAATPHMSA